MPQRPASTYFRLGLFVLVGLGCLVAVLFMLGRKQNLFGNSLEVQADFRNVSGLLTGNNVRLGGISVGTVKAIRILNDSTVRVGLSLDREVQPYVKKNTIASIGTDGLVGNTIINLKAAPAPSPAIESGDVLRTTTPLALDAMLGTLNVSNKNLVGITKDLREITHKLNGSDALWKLLNDQQLAVEMHRSLQNLAAATAQLQGSATDMQQLTHGLRQGRGPAGYLLTDTAFAGRMRHATRQLASTSDTLAHTLAGLKHQMQTPNGPLNTLLADTATARNLRQSLRNVELGTAGFSQNMEALKHNFLLRGYFRKQAKKDRARAAAE
ncbi:MCE family protein [Microvirga sp. STS02]|uniref:MlaD family protein n=1 Tax=Hymenobacter negativus TaxID=2795026 RepID=UPI0018DC0BAB|nr:MULTISPECIES: MlaD family protein [Bacteria]MBH8569196.1 MCE family protein [Hymenobacter negativus]MBR7208931.1 MCE family protein [Microvirga sp. STS02]